MNYYNPYYTMVPYTNMMASAATKPGLFSSLLGGVKGLNWTSIISNTQRTLGLVNQAIPVIKQVTPVVKNAKTMFQVMNEFKKVDEPLNKVNSNSIAKNNLQTATENIDNTDIQTTTDNNVSNTPNKVSISNVNEPTFFI